MTSSSTGRLKVVFLDRGTFAESVQFSEFAFDHSFTAYDHTAPHEVAQRISDADVVIVNKIALSEELQRRAKKLKIIGVAATGTDVVDKQAAKALGIPVINVEGYAVNSVPEHVIGLTLALRRNIRAYHEAVVAGAWSRSSHFCFHDFPVRDLAGSSLGIVGKGALGQAVGRLGAALGMKVAYAARRGAHRVPEGYVGFEDMLRQADVISLHCPLTPETKGLLGAEEFALMQKRPIVVNAARGPLIDSSALIDAIDGGQISGAGLDVLDQEPPPADDPLLALADRPNVLITPHVAWASAEAMQTLANMLVSNIDKAVAALNT